MWDDLQKIVTDNATAITGALGAAGGVAIKYISDINKSKRDDFKVQLEGLKIFVDGQTSSINQLQENSRHMADEIKELKHELRITSINLDRAEERAKKAEHRADIAERRAEVSERELKIAKAKIAELERDVEIMSEKLSKLDLDVAQAVPCAPAI